MTPDTDDQIEHDRTDSYLLGVAAGIEGEAGRLRVKAGELFAVSKDRDAELYRVISRELDEQAKLARAKWQEHKAQRT